MKQIAQLEEIINEITAKEYPQDVSSEFCMNFWEIAWSVKDLTKTQIYIDKFQDALTVLRKDESGDNT